MSQLISTTRTNVSVMNEQNNTKLVNRNEAYCYTFELFPSPQSRLRALIDGNSYKWNRLYLMKMRTLQYDWTRKQFYAYDTKTCVSDLYD